MPLAVGLARAGRSSSRWGIEPTVRNAGSGSQDIIVMSLELEGVQMTTSEEMTAFLW